MGPTKAVVKDGGIYDAKTGKLIKDGLTTHEAIQDYVAHHYLVLPVVNKACQPWLLDGQPIFCLRALGMKISKMTYCTSLDVRIVAAWASEMTNR